MKKVFLLLLCVLPMACQQEAAQTEAVPTEEAQKVSLLMERI